MLQSSQLSSVPVHSPSSTATVNNSAVPRKMPFSSGLSLHVTVYISPKDIDRFLEAFKSVFDKVVAEPECLFFEMYQNPQEPGKISWVENWSGSPEWFLENQVTKDYYKEYFAKTEAMFTKPREFQFLQRVGPDYFMVKNDPFAQN